MIQGSWETFFLAVLVVLGAMVLEPSHTEALNVLVLQPLHGASHEAQLRTFADELLTRGHQVTIVRFRGTKRRNRNSEKILPPANLTVITLTVPNEDGSIPFVTKGRHGRFQLPLKRLWRLGLCPAQIPLSAFYTNDALCKILLPPKGRLRRRLQRYDVSIVDAFANECGLALAHDLGIPAVAYWALPLSGGEGDYAAGMWRPPLMANTPAIMTKLSDQMNYVQRLQNAVFRIGGHVVMSIQFWVTHLAIQRYLPGTPHPRRLIEDVTGLLENSDVALDYPKALPPNVINVGCMQCRPPKPLPQDLEEFVEGSGSAGIVVFSMGATIDAAVAPRAFFRRLLNVFGRLPQRVLMKFDGSVDGEDIPPNVRILAWMPQQDLLGHRRTRAFFAHCGFNGAMEAVYHGVPVVGMPIFGDQTDVAMMLEERGMGVRLAKDASEDEIVNALNQVTGDPRYRQNALKRRRILLDTPHTPMERAVSFVEYIARHKGAPHLRLATRHYNAIELFGLDVLPALLLGAFLFFYLSYKIVRVVFRGSYSAVVWAVSKAGFANKTKSLQVEVKGTAPRVVETIPLVASLVAYSRKLFRRLPLTVEVLKQGLLAVAKEGRTAINAGGETDAVDDEGVTDTTRRGGNSAPNGGLVDKHAANGKCSAKDGSTSEVKPSQFSWR